MRRGSTRSVRKGSDEDFSGHEGRSNLAGSLKGSSTSLDLAGHGSDEIGNDIGGKGRRLR